MKLALAVWPGALEIERGAASAAIERLERQRHRLMAVALLNVLQAK
jgi:hypothetical protein